MREASAPSSPFDHACSRRVMSFAGSSATLLSYINSPSFLFFLNASGERCHPEPRRGEGPAVDVFQRKSRSFAARAGARSAQDDKRALALRKKRGERNDINDHWSLIIL